MPVTPVSIMQSNIKRICAILFITAFLASIPLSLAQTQDEYVKVVIDIKADDIEMGVANAGGKGISQGYILSGPKWKVLPVNIVVDSGMTIPNVNVQQALTDAAEAWDSNTVGNIFGTVTYGTVSIADETQAPDGKNEIMFGTFTNNGIIAQTTYWYSRRGGEIFDFDIVFNTYYTWGDSTISPGGTSKSMDFLNIAIHEIGHGFGLSDLYQSKYNIQTMYGYAGADETSKRTLEYGDIAGIKALYG